MASSSLLSIVAAFCESRGLVAPTSVTSSTDLTIAQIRRLVNEGVRELIDRSDWKCMQLLSAVTPHLNGANYLAIDLEQALPDYKWMIPDTLWETTTRLPVAGPLSESQRSQLITMQVTPAQFSFWIGPGTRGEALFIYPYTAASRFQFQYQSLYPWMSSTGTPQEIAINDGDLCQFPTRILLADINWRWNYKKGFPYAEEKAAFEAAIANLDSAQQPAKQLDLGGGGPTRFAGPGLLIPAGSWNV